MAILSLDIGTSSVKGSIVELGNPETVQNYNVIVKYQSSYDTERIRPKDLPPDHSQQRVEVIFKTIDNVLYKLKCLIEEKKPDLAIQLVTVCGQTHGCVLWSHKFPCSGDGPPPSLDYSLVSDLYDWTDNRCREDFLRRELPSPESYADRISSGFGCATLFWLQKNRPELLNHYDRSGTIMDCFVSVLCHDSNGPTPISINNAHSWGYFDPEKRMWNTEILERAGFPVRLLPKPVALDTIVGRSRTSGWHAILPDTPVVVPYGDLESMMFLAFNRQPNNSVVMNMGTSAQLCRLIGVKEEFPKRKSTSPYPGLDCYPFTNENDLIVAASLNGGNVLRSFSSFLRQTVRALTGQVLSESAVWYKIFKLDSETVGSRHPNLKVCPTLFGERHDPGKGCQIQLSLCPPTLMDLTEGIADGLIGNLLEMMPDLMALIQNGKVTKIICTGSVLSHNPILQRVVEKRFKYAQNDSASEHLDIEYLDDCDADVGCALFAAKQLRRI